MPLLALIAAAGQAVGPVLSGSTSGAISLTVERAVVLLSNGVSVSGATAAVATQSDEGDSFTVAVETAQGSTHVVTLIIDNNSAQDASAILELNIPAGLDVEVDSGSDIREAWLSRSQWLLEVPVGWSGTIPGVSGTLMLTIEPQDNAKPGFHVISGRVVQTSG